MQYQQGANLNAEYVDDKNQRGSYQPPVGQAFQPVVGQPVGQYYQQQVPYPQYIQGGPQYYPQQLNSGYQQVVIVPNSQVVIMAQPMNPVLAKEFTLRQYSKYFYGCNCCLGVLAFIFLIIRCVATFGEGGAAVAAGVMYIISDFFFVVGVICGLYAVSRYVDKLLVHYQVFLAIALIFELIGSIIAFATYGVDENSNDDDDEYSYSNSNQDESKHRNINIVAFVILLIILIIAYGLFIRQARRIRFLMIDLQQTRIQYQNEQAQGAGPAMNNPFPGQGVILR